MTKEFFYRYHDPAHSSGEIYLSLHAVVRRTPSGVWVEEFEHASDYQKFINFKWNKQFAHATKEEAFEAYKARKRRQITILKAQLRHAEKCLELAETGKRQTDPFEFLIAEPN